MADIAKLKENLAARHLELDDVLDKLELLKELSVTQKEKVRIKPESPSAHGTFCACVCVCICAHTHGHVFVCVHGWMR